MYTFVIFLFALAIAIRDIPGMIMSKDWKTLATYGLLVAGGLGVSLLFQLDLGPSSVTRIFIDPVRDYLPALASFFDRTAF